MTLLQAKNIINYLRIIHRILAPGGVWINIGRGGRFGTSSSPTDYITGPLLWHFENNATNDPSVELDLEEVKTLARKIGFVISVGLYIAFRCVHLTKAIYYQDERTIDTTYTSNSRSMLGYVYKTAFWTATKA